jgi:predicted nucleic acid-binding protein
MRRSFADRLEPLIYWDTTFALSVRIDTERFHAECVAFRNRLDAEGVVSVVSDFVYDELAFVLMKRSLLAEARRVGKRWMDIHNEHPEFLATVYHEIQTIKTDLEVATLKLTVSDAVTDKAFQLMRNFHLLPTDAYHSAVALDAGVNTFASLDEHFLRVDDIIVYTCLP